MSTTISTAANNGVAKPAKKVCKVLAKKHAEVSVEVLNTSTAASQVFEVSPAQPTQEVLSDSTVSVLSSDQSSQTEQSSVKKVRRVRAGPSFKFTKAHQAKGFRAKGGVGSASSLVQISGIQTRQAYVSRDLLIGAASWLHQLKGACADISAESSTFLGSYECECIPMIVLRSTQLKCNETGEEEPTEKRVTAVTLSSLHDMVEDLVDWAEECAHLKKRPTFLQTSVEED
jgi:hypothetical protein